MASCLVDTGLVAGTTVIRFSGTSTTARVYAVSSSDPASCPGVVALSSEEFIKLSEVLAPTLSLDYGQLALVWAFFCTFTVSLFLFSQGCNQVLNAVKKG